MYGSFIRISMPVSPGAFAYPEATYRRLAAIKRRYHPTNLFRVNQNIAPDGRTGR